MRQLDDATWVSGQIHPDDVPQLKAEGVTLIVNNRPDGEEAGQPLSAEIEKAARAHGIDFRFIPIARGIGPSDAEAMQEAIQTSKGGRMLAYCKSGTRSALTWAVAQSKAGMAREDVEHCVRRAGVDPTPVAHLL